MDKRGDFGIGTLTIFIAMILIGAIAAGVLISTTTSTQQQALATGEDSEKELVTMMRIFEAAGTDGSDGELENISITVRLVAGSNPIKFEDTLIQFDTDTYSAHFNYLPPINSSTYCLINNASQQASQCNTLANDEGQGTYTYEYINRGRNGYDGALTNGDAARLHFAINATLPAGSYYRIYVVPSHGTPDLVETNTPNVISQQFTSIYP